MSGVVGVMGGGTAPCPPSRPRSWRWWLAAIPVAIREHTGNLADRDPPDPGTAPDAPPPESTICRPPPPHPATTTRRTWPTLERASTPLGPSACTSWRSSASSAPCPRWSSRSCPTGRRAAGRAPCPRLVAVPLLLLSAASGRRRFRALRGRDALRTRAGSESYDDGEPPGASGRLPRKQDVESTTCQGSDQSCESPDQRRKLLQQRLPDLVPLRALHPLARHRPAAAPPIPRQHPLVPFQCVPSGLDP